MTLVKPFIDAKIRAKNTKDEDTRHTDASRRDKNQENKNIRLLVDACMSCILTHSKHTNIQRSLKSYKILHARSRSLHQKRRVSAC